MARVSIVNRAKLSARLSWLLLRAGLRSVGGRVNCYRPLTCPVPPHKNDRLLIAPQDLRTADATRASEVYSGRFAFAGKVVICDGRSVFEMTPPSDDWATELPARIAAWAAADPATLMERVQARRMDRCEQFAMIAAREAWADAGAPSPEPERLGVVVSSGIGGVGSTLSAYDTLKEKG